MNDYSSILNKLIEERENSHLDLPKLETVYTLVDSSLALLFPHFARYKQSTPKIFDEVTTSLEYLKLEPGTIHLYLNSLPEILSKLKRDAIAHYEGDPAAKSLEEVILAYPGFYAVAVYRLAHLLQNASAPLIPRVMTEYAHRQTGIDIHPGASIDVGFCIDHGTGVVIGETSTIHEGVKMYQGVTLGAMSVAKKLSGKKRHPTIEKNVVIYSHATILGGDTVIGEGSVIGGNVWLTQSVPANSRVYSNPSNTVR